MVKLYQDKLKEQIGTESYSHLEDEAEKEVALAIQMPLKDQWRQDKYYHRRFLLTALLKECEEFENLGIKLSPLDVVHALFNCKLAFAVGSLDEFHQRGGTTFHENPRIVQLPDKAVITIDVFIHQFFEEIEKAIGERILLSELSNFKTFTIRPEDRTPTVFFEALFKTLEFPFSCYFDAATLPENTDRFFPMPSMGFATTGTSVYAYLYASAWLRVFLNLLRIAGFLYAPQQDFGGEGVEIKAPTAPVFLGTRSFGGFSWGEDTKKPWEKIPDGCLFLSFGYRGIAQMYFDERIFGAIEKFFVNNKAILEHLKNPWTTSSINDIAPSLDILSSVTQTPDLGAKILLLYCCLEHLFVPKNITRNNTKYIVGGIHTIDPKLTPWFDRLYDVRNSYAHKGFVDVNNNLHSLIRESMQNILQLLKAKLSLRK